MEISWKVIIRFCLMGWLLGLLSGCVNPACDFPKYIKTPQGTYLYYPSRGTYYYITYPNNAYVLGEPNYPRSVPYCTTCVNYPPVRKPACPCHHKHHKTVKHHKVKHRPVCRS
jgi:hypothetical protein